MPYVSQNYANNPAAPMGTWVGAPPHYGQCVSYVKTVTPSLPQTSQWTKGALVKGNSAVKRLIGPAEILVNPTFGALQSCSIFWHSPPSENMGSRKRKVGLGPRGGESATVRHALRTLIDFEAIRSYLKENLKPYAERIPGTGVRYSGMHQSLL
jgi:hypothetical protein